MKGGVAVMLKLAAEADDAPMDLTWIFYDHEEVAAADNSLTRIAAEHPGTWSATSRSWGHRPPPGAREAARAPLSSTSPPAGSAPTPAVTGAATTASTTWPRAP